jgi:hypothetical protein
MIMTRMAYSLWIPINNLNRLLNTSSVKSSKFIWLIHKLVGLIFLMWDFLLSSNFQAAVFLLIATSASMADKDAVIQQYESVKNRRKIC